MKPLFREQVTSQQTARIHGNVSLVQVPAFTWLTGVVAFIVLFSLFFLLIGNYSRKTSVIGVLQPEQGVIRVQSFQSGIVHQLFVKEGDKVEPGQPLMQLNMQHFSSEQTELNASLQQEHRSILDNLQQQKKHELAKFIIRKQEITELIANITLQLNQVRAQQNMFQQRLELNQHLVEQISQLSGTGFVSNLELSRQQDILLSLRQQEQVLKGQQLMFETQLKQQRSILDQMPLDHNATIAKLDIQISELRNQLTRLQHEQSSMIRAPKTGIVSGIILKPGHFVSSGDIALSLIPENSKLEAVIYVPTSAIAFIDLEREVRLRIHAFPYERFGVHIGKVFEISRTVFMPEEVTDMNLQEPSYRVKVRLLSQNIEAYNRELPLKAGMTLDGDIVTERRSLLRWLFDPIYSIKGQL